MKRRMDEQFLWLNGKKYASENLETLRQEIGEEATSPLVDVYVFLQTWFDDSLFLTVQTSGSTGTPKVLTVRKEQMMQSARLTCEQLNLREGDTALLCMNLRYIGAMMMVVRALVAGLNLIVRSATGHPLADVDGPLHFAAMVPLQVYNTFQVQAEREKLYGIDTLIIGGGAVDKALETEIRTLGGAVFSTYGMTETLSHIALRRLNGTDASEHYYPFPSVQLSLSAEQTLVIEAPLVCDDVLQTNDVASIYPDGSFVILGRKDNIINSGGVKVQAEEVERELRAIISVPFAITSVPDARLGQAIVLLIENLGDAARLKREVRALLAAYDRPKYLWSVDQIPHLENEKIDRVACRALAQRLWLSRHT